MLKPSNTRQITLPGWRDFERACAIAFDGVAVENKFFVDVIFPFDTHSGTFYGIDCKMRGELGKAKNHGKIYVEVTNAAKYLWSYLATKGISETNFKDEPELAGMSLIEAVEQMKTERSSQYPAGPIITDHSFYFVLLWDDHDRYQLFQLPLKLPYPEDLTWTCNVGNRTDGTETTRLVGADTDGILYEWYGSSGGQFKYYPSISQAIWTSTEFKLEPLNENIEIGIKAKVKTYFPAQWKWATEE